MKIELGTYSVVVKYVMVPTDDGLGERSVPEFAEVDATLEIDVAKLTRPLIRKAALSKKGTSKLAAGAVVVRVRR